MFAKVNVRRSDARSFLQGVAKHGLPRKLVTSLRHWGATALDIRTATQTILNTNPRQIAGREAALFSRARLLSSLRQEASVLRAYAKRISANPKVSLN